MAPHTKKPRSSSACKPIFAGKVFAACGDFGESITHADIERYIMLRGGRFEKEVTGEVQYLVCTIEQYKKDVPRVKAAKKLGNARCKIVTWDFIEDCMHAKSRKGKWLDIKEYQLSKVVARVRQGNKEKARHKTHFKTVGMEFEEVVSPKADHIYCDETSFEYKITLTRMEDFAREDGTRCMEKFTIYLFESNGLPQLYKVAGSHRHSTRRDLKWCTKYLADKDFEPAFKDFKTLFQEMTGIEWDQRCDKLKPDPKLYFYSPPEDGKPVGVLPRVWNLPEDLEGYMCYSSDDSKAALAVSVDQVACHDEVK